MMFEKILDRDYHGYLQVPHIPRAARSVRKRCLLKMKSGDKQMCAFDLLATIAGKLLVEGEDSPPSVGTSSPTDQLPDSVQKKDESAQRSNNRDFHERNFMFTELEYQNPDSNFSANEISFLRNDKISRPSSVITNSNESEGDDDCKLSVGILGVKSSSGFRLSPDFAPEYESRKVVRNNLSLSQHHPEVLDRKTPAAVVDSVDSVKLPFYPLHRDSNVKLVSRDDDDNFLKCAEPPSNRNKEFRTPSHFGIRKSLASKDCKLMHVKDDDEHWKEDSERYNYLNKKESLKRQRSIKDYPFKKRKLYDSGSVSNSCDGNANDLQNAANEQKSGKALPTSTLGERTSFHSPNQQVKLKIKSFRVPELIIELPESATVGSLKRTVKEAVLAVLGGGLRVGVVLQGKKIRDDNKTLLQTGISHDNKMETNLSFALEPVQGPIQLYPEDQPHQLLHDSPKPLARYPSTQDIVQQGNVDMQLNLNRNNYNNFIESDHDSAPSPPEASLQRTEMESKALVAVPNMRPDALTVVGPMRKLKRSESAQRRIRRPFAVAEVEALVQAVEKLGTGRWRDVKLRAFDNAKHRTYVDLKDKWKTLVHTARISPQQRRGEPVPQELLDRVLAAHAYWSQQQAKQQLKSQLDTSLLLWSSNTSVESINGRV